MSLETYQQAIDAGLDSRTASYIGALDIIDRIIKRAEETQNLFLLGKGLTWKQVRNWSDFEQDTLDREYKIWYYAVCVWDTN